MRLLAIYRESAAIASDTSIKLARTLQAEGPDKFSNMFQEGKSARSQAEDARIAYQEHIVEHGCEYKPPAIRRKLGLPF